MSEQLSSQLKCLQFGRQCTSGTSQVALHCLRAKLGVRSWARMRKLVVDVPATISALEDAEDSSRPAFSQIDVDRHKICRETAGQLHSLCIYPPLITSIAPAQRFTATLRRREKATRAMYTQRATLAVGQRPAGYQLLLGACPPRRWSSQFPSELPSSNCVGIFQSFGEGTAICLACIG